MLVPIYCCDSILIPIRELGLNWYCYDINPEDLNPCIKSIEQQINHYKADCVVTVSMYGNPAELDKIEELCKKKAVRMIDDAAQSFGATVAGRKVGYFGDAGFFSFSPGKPLAGHLGGAYRTTNEEYKIEYTKHPLSHWLNFKDFEHNRQQNHFKKDVKGRFYGLGCRLLNKLSNIRNDKYSSFEEGNLYGIYKDSLYIHNPYRTEYAKRMSEEISTEALTVLKPYSDEYRTGIAHKYILICKSKEIADGLIDYLYRNQVSSQLGYKMLTDSSGFEGAKQVEGCVVEIPLNAVQKEFEYIQKLLNIFRT